MNKYLHTDPWCIIEEDFNVNNQLASESVFSAGNGLLIQRANLEEYYSGDTILGSNITGINGLENSELLKLNAGSVGTTTNMIADIPAWIGITVRLNEDRLDLAVWEVQNFKRVLNMHEGVLERSFEAISKKGHHIIVSVKRFLSMAETEVGAISYSVKSLNFEGRISFMPVIDADLNNLHLSTLEPIWNVLQTKTQQDVAHLWTQTRRTDFHVCSAFTYVLYKNNEQLNIIPAKIEKEKVAGFSIGTDVKKGDTLCLNKYVAILNSTSHPRNELTKQACSLARFVKQKGWNKLFEEHTSVLAERWSQQEGTVDSDIDTQHADRYRLFRVFQGLDEIVDK